uniref:Palmitoyl-protein thioesterase 1 n=1 Tax=Noccaea caerulescens TaxID=107243 RepID=A0A1J3K026_NOCCA
MIKAQKKLISIKCSVLLFLLLQLASPKMISVSSSMEKRFQRSSLLVTLSLLLFSIPKSISVPFIVFHGIQDQCSNREISSFTQLIGNLSGSPGSCLEIGNGEEDSWFMPLTQQVSIACEKVKQMKELSQGYNIVAQSQGNCVARGLIEFCDDGPPVLNYVSLGGPQAGIANNSKCSVRSSPICQLLTTEVYTDNVQDHIAPSGYVKIPTEMSEYLAHSKFLPKLNNERPNQRNSTFKERFTSLHNLVLVMFQDDTIVMPKESSWFGYYPEGASTPLLPPQQTKLYTEDWIGLKTLDDAGKVKFVSVPGEHLQMAEDDIVKYVVPYLKNQLTFSS